MWGMTFMITWFGSVVYWLFDNRLDRKNIAKGRLVFFSLFAAIVVFGIVRMNLPLQNSSVKISGIHTHDKVKEAEQMNVALSRNDTILFKKISNSILERIIKETREEAKKNARIIVWSEISTMNLDSDEDSAVTIFRRLAQEEKIYLMTNPFSIGTNGAISENKILFFAPNGEVVLSHMKYGGNFMEGTLEGNKSINTIATPYGNLAAAICWDADFPSIVKQAGNSNADILLIPASNWKEIAPLHTIVAVFRGIENGCSIVRQTRNGLSIITDPTGKIITQLDHFSTKSWIMTGEVPNKKLWTLYPFIGDLFGWLAISGFVSMMLWVCINQNRQANQKSRRH
jgi:apolipoprotein N-acyltransferase